MTHPDTHPMTLYPDSRWRAVAPRVGGVWDLDDLGALRTEAAHSLRGEVWWRTGEVDQAVRKSARHRWYADVGGRPVRIRAVDDKTLDDIAAILAEHLEARQQGEAP